MTVSGGDREGERREGDGGQRQRLEGRHDQQSSEAGTVAWDGLALNLQREPTRQHLDFPGLQNRGRINFRFKPSISWQFLMAA